jgi:hypothetical protein
MFAWARLFLSPFLILTAASSFAQDLPKSYKVSVEIEQYGKIIGTPTFVVQPGHSATMTAPVQGYAIRAKVDPDGSDARPLIRVGLDVYFLEKGRWILAGTPFISTAPGEGGWIQYENPNMGRSVITYRVEPVPSAGGQGE